MMSLEDEIKHYNAVIDGFEGERHNLLRLWRTERHKMPRECYLRLRQMININPDYDESIEYLEEVNK